MMAQSPTTTANNNVLPHKHNHTSNTTFAFRLQDPIPQTLVRKCVPLRHCAEDSDGEHDQPTPVRFRDVTPSMQFTKFAPYILDYVNHGLLPIHNNDVPEDDLEDLLRCLEWCCIDDDDLHPCIRALHTRSVHEQFARLKCMHAELLEPSFGKEEDDGGKEEADVFMGTVHDHEDTDMQNGNNELTQAEKDFRSTPTDVWEHMCLALHHNFAWVVSYIDAARNTTHKVVVHDCARICRASKHIIEKQQKRYKAWAPSTQDMSSLIEAAAAHHHDSLFNALWDARTWTVDITSSLLVNIFKSGSHQCRRTVMRHANVLSVQDVTDAVVLMIQSTPAAQSADILVGLQLFIGFKLHCRSVLQAACVRGSIELLDYFLAKPAFVAAFTRHAGPSSFMQQCLHILAHNGFDTTLEWLVNKQTHAVVHVENAWSLLQEAATQGQDASVRWIVQHFPHVLTMTTRVHVVNMIQASSPTIQRLLFASYENTGFMSMSDAHHMSRMLWKQALTSDNVEQAKWLHRFTSRRTGRYAHMFTTLKTMLLSLPAIQLTPRIALWLNTVHEREKPLVRETHTKPVDGPLIAHLVSQTSKQRSRNRRRRSCAQMNLCCYEELVL